MESSQRDQKCPETFCHEAVELPSVAHMRLLVARTTKMSSGCVGMYEASEVDTRKHQLGFRKADRLGLGGS